MPKCPVCKNDHASTDEKCSNCGFTQLHKEFINPDELMRWMEETVIPCQAIYNKMVQKLESSETIPSIRTENSAEDISYPKSFTATTIQTTCEISDIRFIREKDEDGEYGEPWLEFIAKKTHDDFGKTGKNYIGFNCRVKDSRGVIICNENWSEFDLKVGDVIEGHIWFGYFPDDLTGWTIEFTDED